MGAIGAFFSFLLMIPTIGITLLIVYVLKKSFTKPTPKVMAAEKLKMEEKVSQLSRELNNRPFDVAEITNNLSHFWSRSITRRSSGHVLTMQDEPIIAFQRIETGWGGSNVRILAATSGFRLYFELQNRNLKVFYNSEYLGQLDALHNIVDASGKTIGKSNRLTLSNVKGKPEAYPVFINNSHIADIAVCFDMRTIGRNPLHKISGPVNEKTNPTYIQYDALPHYQLVSLKTEPTEDAMKWLTALATFESIYYTLDFV